MLERTKDIVRRAAELMMREDFEIEQKGGIENIVTTSDLAVQEFLCRELAAALPGCGFICEEEGVMDPDKEYVWVIDPIDGTANYARGIDACAISVGLMHNPVRACLGSGDAQDSNPYFLKNEEEMILGVVYSPARNEMYWAEKGKGAFCNGKPIRTSSRSFEAGILCTAMSTYRKEYADVCSEIIMDAFHQCNDVRRFGAASVELCFLAAGLCELYFEMRLQPWDYAAGMIILTEAGGAISSLDGRQMRFDGPDLVCAGNSAANHARMLSIIRKHLPAIPYTD